MESLLLASRPRSISMRWWIVGELFDAKMLDSFDFYCSYCYCMLKRKYDRRYPHSRQARAYISSEICLMLSCCSFECILYTLTHNPQLTSISRILLSQNIAENITFHVLYEHFTLYNGDYNTLTLLVPRSTCIPQSFILYQRVLLKRAQMLFSVRNSPVKSSAFVVFSTLSISFCSISTLAVSKAWSIR